MTKFKSKLPADVRAKLAKQLRALFTGKVETIKVNVSLSIPIKIGYGWATEAKGSYNVLNPENNSGKFYGAINDKIETLMQPKVNKIDSKIKNFYDRMERVCKKYQTDVDDEFNFVINEHKLHDCSSNWY